MGFLSKSSPNVQEDEEQAHIAVPAVERPINYGGDLDEYLDELREEFITYAMTDEEEAALAEMMDREPDEVPEFPDHLTPAVIQAYASHAISSAYIRAGRDIVMPGETDNKPPFGSDGGQVVTQESVVIGYGWLNDHGDLTSIASATGELIQFDEQNEDIKDGA